MTSATLLARIGAARLFLEECPGHLWQAGSRTQAAAFLEEFETATVTAAERTTLIEMGRTVRITIDDATSVFNVIAPYEGKMLKY